MTCLTIIRKEPGHEFKDELTWSLFALSMLQLLAHKEQIECREPGEKTSELRGLEFRTTLLTRRLFLSQNIRRHLEKRWAVARPNIAGGGWASRLLSSDMRLLPLKSQKNHQL